MVFTKTVPAAVIAQRGPSFMKCVCNRAGGTSGKQNILCLPEKVIILFDYCIATFQTTKIVLNRVL